MILNQLDKFLIVAIAVFSLLILPFLGSIPYLDGNIDFVRSYDFYTGGFEKYFANWNSVHPPLKLFLTNIFFTIGGLNSYAYTLAGYLFGIMGIIAIFKLTQKIFNRQTARISAILLATSPLFLATGIFGLTDYLLTALILIALAYYVKGKYFFYSLGASLAVLTKEPGLLLPMSAVFIELVYLVRNLIAGKSVDGKLKISFCFLPFLAAYLWGLFIRTSGQTIFN